MVGRYDPSHTTPPVECIECGDLGRRGGNTTFACACLARKVRQQGEQLATLEARLAALEAKREQHDTEAA